jgi:DNA gyrase/topoisomerase IV subunit A
MISQEKIEAWIQEALERPESATEIIQQIARRLGELTARNESLLAENILLQSGKKVEEYERRIAHLEYQLDLMKRQFGGELLVAGPDAVNAGPLPVESMSLLAYDGSGRVLRQSFRLDEVQDGSNLGSLSGRLSEQDPPRLLVATEKEELLFIFTSGRVATLEASQIQPAGEAGPGMEWEHAPRPSEPNAGEKLACLAPLSRMALADYFLQVSRKGYLKKIRASMGESILANRYIGTGVRQAPDQTFELLLCTENDRLALVSAEGFLQCLEISGMAPMVDEALRLDSRDHLVSAFLPQPGQPILAMTQIGKAVHWTEDRLEVSQSNRTRGQAMFSASRRSQGVRVVQAGSVGQADWVAALHDSGQLTLHKAGSILRSGAIPVQDELLAFTFFSLPAGIPPAGSQP